MSEKEEILSKKALIVIGITFLLIFVISMILLGLGLNEAFYSTSSGVRAFFTVITNLGEPLVFIIISALIYIAYDKRLAKNLVFSLITSSYINEVLKNIFQDPRPPANIDASEMHGFVETSYGFPSGHSQTAVSYWGYLAYGLKDKGKKYVIPVILSVLIFLVAISRIIIGVHDLQDIWGGLLIGIGYLLVFIYLEPVFSEKFSALSLNVKIIFAILVSLVLFTMGTLLFPATGFGLVSNPPLYTDGGGFAQGGGVVLGFGVGYILENEKVNYEPSRLDTKQKLINIVIGMLIIFIAYFGLEALKPVFNSVIYRYIRYALISFILAYLLPLLFTKINK